MKTAFLSAILICFSAVGIFSQKKVQGSKTPPKKSDTKTVENPAVKEISAADWKEISDALQVEDWEKSLILARRNLQKLVKDNAKKQLAQLNYIFLYSLAGKVSEGKMSFEELEKIARSNIGKNFVQVSRQILADCSGKLNYICTQKNSDKILRVTATNKQGNAIHFFEYIKLTESFDLTANVEKIAFTGGVLERVETVEHQNGAKYLRLIFAKSFIRIATD